MRRASAPYEIAPSVATSPTHRPHRQHRPTDPSCASSSPLLVNTPVPIMPPPRAPRRCRARGGARRSPRRGAFAGASRKRST
jgi:hypothetical protein